MSFIINKYLSLVLFILFLSETNMFSQEKNAVLQKAKQDSIRVIETKPMGRVLNSVSTNVEPVYEDVISVKGELTVSPDEPPVFPGGPGALAEYLEKELIYPTEALHLGIQGVVIVTFSIEINGQATGPLIITDKVGYGASEEVQRLVQSMPKWVPAYKQKVAVPVYYTMPVFFKIRK